MNKAFAVILILATQVALADNSISFHCKGMEGRNLIGEVLLSDFDLEVLGDQVYVSPVDSDKTCVGPIEPMEGYGNDLVQIQLNEVCGHDGRKIVLDKSLNTKRLTAALISDIKFRGNGGATFLCNKK